VDPPARRDVARARLRSYQQHLELAAFYSKIAVAYTQIVTISTDIIGETREVRASVAAQWTSAS
jgi:hypothetical protein